MKSPYEIYLEDFNWALGLNRLSLRLMGVWPDDDVIEAKFLTTILRVPFMIIVIFSFVVMPQVYALILVRKNFLLIIDNIMTSFPTLTCCLKLYFLWSSKEVLRSVVASVSKDWLQSKTDWEYREMKSMAAVAKFFTIGGYSLLMGSLLGFIIAPLCGLDIRVEQNITDYGNHHLLVQSYYPYDYSKSPYFEVTHFSQVFASWFITMALAVPDNYFGALVFHLSGQFEILGVSVEQFIRLDNKILKSMTNRTFNKNIGVFVERHVHLIGLVSSVEKSFTLTILTQLLCMCVMVCCLGVRILYSLTNPSGSASVAQIINLGVCLISLMLFTLSNCYASEILTSRSTGVYHHIYNSEWYTIPEHNTRDLILIMIMSKNDQSLTAGKMVYLSLSTFCNIVKTIAGYISVLIAHSS